MEALSDKIWTYEDYLQLPDDGLRYEVIDGSLYMTPSPSTLHQTLSRRLQFLFYELERNRLGYIFNAPTDLMLEGGTPVVPDLVYLEAAQKTQIEKGFIQGPPLLIVEIASPSTIRRDRVNKLRLYARNRVPHYWLLSPDSRTLEMLRLDQDSYRLDRVLGPGESHTCSEFHDLLVDMDALFEGFEEESPER